MAIGSPGAPSEGAAHFVLDGKHRQYDAYIDLVMMFDNTWSLDCRYREIGTTGKWAWLIGPDIDGSNLLTGVDADNAMHNALSIINDEIKRVFGGDVKPIPENGIQRLEWIVTNAISESGNVLSMQLPGEV
ncbi:hypothetical protein LJ739_06705 [Aestuariibacter halophilus]|uniref:Uncharacterized protein n=1 Tax=Fluctibacter halophilus TaxID=226011 RepID=A0ABS8G739_9ALTE|nr:hypothetical protein [Aestuariibacter halophilus]MCC2615926.1 hypothetical protein [Aestuariibacter halophilus]